MIKVDSGIAKREPIPDFLFGLGPESLADLTWTDPSLGLRDCAWWPEEDATRPLGHYEKYSGKEKLTADMARRVVVVLREIVPWTAEEIAADKASRVPARVTRRQARQALLLAGHLDKVGALIAAIPDPLKRGMAQIELDDSLEYERNRPLVVQMGIGLGLDSDGLDALFIMAASL